MGIEHLISHENVIIEWYFKTDKVVVFDHMWLAICSQTEVKYKMISQVISNIVIILCYLEMSTEQWLQKNDTPFSYLSFKCHMKGKIDAGLRVFWVVYSLKFLYIKVNMYLSLIYIKIYPVVSVKCKTQTSWNGA